MTSQRDEALPPLPKAYYTIAWAEENGMYSAGQMRDYARAALAAAPAAQPQSDLNVKTMYCLECERLSRELAEVKAKTEPHQPAALTEFLTEEDKADLLRIEDLFSDGEGYDLPKEQMRRLAEIGVIRHTSAGRYAITSFGMWCIGTWPVLPLKTAAESNAEAWRLHQARIGAQEQA